MPIGPYPVTYTDESPFSAFHNDEIRTLFEAARVEMDVAEREQIYHRVFELGREDPPAIFLLQLVDLWALTERTQFKTACRWSLHNPHHVSVNTAARRRS